MSNEMVLTITDRQAEYLDQIAEDPYEIDAHNDLDTIVGLLRSMAEQWKAQE